MNRESRVRRLKAMIKVAQLSNVNASKADDNFDFNSITRVPSDGQFGSQKMIHSDDIDTFETKDLNELFMRAANNEWITPPDRARSLGLSSLYRLDPSIATDHEKYFGIKTDKGFIHTPATSALFVAAIRGSVPRSDLSQVKVLEVPSELRGRAGMDTIYTLDEAGENRVIGNSVELYLQSGGNTESVRSLNVGKGGEVDWTSTHSQGRHRMPGSKAPSAEVERRMRVVERSVEKSLDSYPRLERTIGTFMDTLSNRMDSLLREQSNVNRSVRFEGSKDEVKDILLQNIFRILMKELKSDHSPLRNAAFYERDYKMI